MSNHERGFHPVRQKAILDGVEEFLLLCERKYTTMPVFAQTKRPRIRGLYFVISAPVTVAACHRLLIATVATGIGLIPVLWGSRRMNCMGVLLLAGVGSRVAGWLGLV
jgi:hypothetical protein